MKERVIILHRYDINQDVESLTYKYSKTAVQDENVADKVAVDTEENLDADIIARISNHRAAILKKKLSFCLKENLEVIVDNHAPLSDEYVFCLSLPNSFDDYDLEIGKDLMHEYMVSAVAMDWYQRVGVNSTISPADLVVLESRIVDVFRSPDVVKVARVPYTPSYRTR